MAPALSLGLLTWAAFLYAGFRARRRSWQWMAAGYFVALAVALAVMPASDPDEFGLLGILSMLIIMGTWMGGFVHALLIRGEFLKTLAATRPWYEDDAQAASEDRPFDRPPPGVSGDAAQSLGLDEAHSQVWGPSGAPSDASPLPPPPESSTRPQRGPNPPSQAAPQGEDRVSLNSAGEETLAALPGIDPILAKRIVAERQRRGGFTSVDELAECGVSPHVVVRLRPVVAVQAAPQQRHRGERRGRTLDI